MHEEAARSGRSRKSGDEMFRLAARVVSLALAPFLLNILMLSRRSIVSFLLAIALLEPGAGLLAEDLAPLPALETDFAALQTNSPFRRSLNLSDSLILTGIANIEGNLFATLLDRKSKETHIVSGAANAQGWRMVGVAGSQSELESMTAQISLAGGEVFSVRFDEQQLKPGEAKPGGGSNGGSGSSGDSNSERRDYREGITGDGRFLYAIDADSRSIFGWEVGASGALTSIGSWNGLPAAVAGLAAG